MSELIYEQGEFKPEIYGKTKAGAVKKYFRQGGKYVRVGNMVTASIYLGGEFDPANKPEGALTIKGLPFECSTEYPNNFGCPSMNHISLCFSKKQEYHTSVTKREVEVTYNLENGVDSHAEFGKDVLNDRFAMGLTVIYFID